MTRTSQKILRLLSIGTAGIVIFAMTMRIMTGIHLPAIGHSSVLEGPSERITYHHAVDQLEWLTEFSREKNDLSHGRPPAIFYDRKIIYHPTSPDGCRYKCVFPPSIGGLTKGDVAVFSTHFLPQNAARLKRRGVIVAFETGESPIHMPKLSSEKLGQIDIFLTYMASSPVPFLYPIFVRNTTPTLKFTALEKSKMMTEHCTQLLPPYHRNRTKLIVWVVSNHRPANNRKDFVDALSKFIPVDIYGTRNKRLPKIGNPFGDLSRDYKFYLAFENSNCKEYITEKVQSNALSNDMVPIVLGAHKEDYENALPPHSYINVDDFPTIQKLAEYLRYLDRNDTAYATYFAWKRYGRIVKLNRPDCRLCGFMYNLNSGKTSLPKVNYSLFTDSNLLCFKRPLLPLT